MDQAFRDLPAMPVRPPRAQQRAPGIFGCLLCRYALADRDGGKGAAGQNEIGIRALYFGVGDQTA